MPRRRGESVSNDDEEEEVAVEDQDGDAGAAEGKEDEEQAADNDGDEDDDEGFEEEDEDEEDEGEEEGEEDEEEEEDEEMDYERGGVDEEEEEEAEEGPIEGAEVEEGAEEEEGGGEEEEGQMEAPAEEEEEEEAVDQGKAGVEESKGKGRARRPAPPPRPSSAPSMTYTEVTRQYEQGGQAEATGGGGGGLHHFPDHIGDIQRLTQRMGKGRKRGRRGGGGKVPGQPKKKKKKRGATGGRVLPEALSRTYGEAQRHYMRAEYKEALRLLNEIIRIAPNVPDPYQLMGQIYEDQRDLKKAAEINLVGCQFGPKDAALWKKTGQMFLELGKPFYLKAQYCFGRAIKLNKKDIEAIADRAHVQSLWGKIDKAVLGYEQILRLNPPQPEAFLIRMADECLREVKLWEKGLLALSDVLCRCMGALFVSKQIKFLPLKPKADRYVPSKKMEVAYEAASTLCRHLMSPSLRKYDQAAAVIQALHFFIAKLRERQTRFEDENPEQLTIPLDLVVRFGICQLYLEKLPSALQCFVALRQRDSNDPEVAELLEDVASAFMDTGKYFRALEVLRRLDTSTALTTATHIRIKLKMARSFLALNQFKGAAQQALEQAEEIGSSGNLVAAAAAAAEGDEVEGESDRRNKKNMYAEAMREAAVLQAAISRGLKDRSGMVKCLEKLTTLLDDILQSAPHRPHPHTARRVPTPVQRRRRLPGTAASPRSRSRKSSSSSAAGAAAGATEGEVAQEGEEETAAAASSAAEREKDYDDEDTVGMGSSVEPETIELELCLEYGLLCRELGRQQDFLSVLLALVELAVFQTKSEFRRSRKKVTAKTDFGGENEEEEGGEEQVEGGGNSTSASSGAVEIPELMARAWERSPMQRALENHIKVYFCRTEILIVLGEPKLFEAARAVVRACIETGMLKEASNITRTLMKRKKLLTDEHGKELHEYVLTHAVSEDDYSSAIKSCLINVQAQPDNIDLCNSLGRLVRKAPKADVNRAVIRRMAHKKPDSIPLTMLSGNAFAISRNYQMALDKFLTAYRLAPTEPIISLSITALLVRVLTHRKLVDRHGCLIKAIGFLERYAQLRREEDPELPVDEAAAGEGGGRAAAGEEEGAAAAGAGGSEGGGPNAKAAKLATEQEVLYNMGRAFHQAGLNHMAVQFYRDALKLQDENQRDFKTLMSKGHLTREAAFNLSSIYHASNNRDLAAYIAQQYLRIEG